MKSLKSTFLKSILSFLIFTLICGILYTGTITVIAKLFFSDKSNGSIIEVNGIKYGSELIGQQYKDQKHMWGRIMNIDTSTFTDKNGNKVMYASPSNLSPASEDYKKLISERISNIKASHIYNDYKPIPVDLITCSGSGLDPEISLAAANYQIQRIAKNNNMSVTEVENIISKCTNKPFLGILGQTTVNVLKVNLIIDGIL